MAGTGRSGGSVGETSRRDLAAALRREVRGPARFDAVTRLLYATDASIYQTEPLGVVLPVDADDVSAAVTVCASHGAPVIARAAGTSLAGQAIGRGVVLDLSAHLRACRIEPEARTARVGPGLVLDDLNRAAARHGLVFGPDPASSDRACLGGIVGTNGAGARSVVHGTTVDHLLACSVVLSDGTAATLRPTPLASVRGGSAGRADRLLADLAAIGHDADAAVARDFPRYWRRSGGYMLDRLAGAVRERQIVDPVVLMAGSEGTLGVLTSVEVRLSELPGARSLLVAHFGELHAAMEAVTVLLATEPSAIELVDDVLIGLARQAPAWRDAAGLFVGSPAAVLVVEYSGASEAEARAGLRRGSAALRAAGHRGEAVRAETPEHQAKVWSVRRAGLGLLMRMRGAWKPVPGIEDTAVPPEALAPYIAEVRALLADRAINAAFYAHASAGCIHIRPILDLKHAAGVAALMELGEAVFELVLRYGGVPSSEHGDGLARGHLNERFFGPEIYAWFRKVKAAFDPSGVLNPGKVVDCPSPAEDRRYGPGYAGVVPAARFAYPLDGDISRAIEQCNGAGVCRKSTGGAMCPSYRVTLDERHTTRARANALRGVVSGTLAFDAMASDALAEVMDLCVGCRACRTECPSGVDVARLKIETSAARVAARGASARARTLAHIHDVQRLRSAAGPLADSVTRAGWPVLARVLSMAPSRQPPALARPSFGRWWAARPVDEARGDRPEIALFVDTTSAYAEPHVARAAVEVMEAAGFRVVVAGSACCGRPALSQGLVDVAIRSMRANVRDLAPLARRGLSVVLLEPSCASALREDMPDLLTRPEERDDARCLADAVVTFDEFVAALPRGALRLEPLARPALVHAHCHQRAAGAWSCLEALRVVPDLLVTESDAGCCGMAGAFGYEAEHYEVSLAMAELRLAPLVRGLPADSLVVAAGASCRQQIRDTTGRDAAHPAVVLASRIGRR